MFRHPIFAQIGSTQRSALESADRRDAGPRCQREGDAVPESFALVSAARAPNPTKESVTEND
jgi:hypothetical protein